MKSGLRRGQLIKWKDERGFGFIQPVDGSKEVFLHISALKDSNRRPQVGDTIYYDLVTEDGKVRASNAFILGARNKPASSSLSQKAASNAVSTFPTLEVLLLSVLPLVGTILFARKTASLVPLILYPAMSFLTFVLYADDKTHAQRGNWRTSEKALHLCELMGGWMGGFIAQRQLHHKSRKAEYQRVFWVIVIIHQIVWLAWLVWLLLATGA